MLEQQSRASSLASLPPAERQSFVAGLTDAEALCLTYDWKFWARPQQMSPPGDWSIWLNLAGRGFGKTRTGAEWVRSEVQDHGARRIAIVAPTAADARKVIVEGESGILAISPPWFRPNYSPSRRQLTWPNGAIATLYSAEEPERLRGPQHDLAWCDELAAWKYMQDAWDQLQFGLRLGDRPRVVITTTPRPVKLIKELLARAVGDNPEVVVTRGTTQQNAANLAPTFLSTIVLRYQGTRLGRQELDGEVIDEVAGALWSRAEIDDLRVAPDQVPQLVRVVVAIDPGATSGENADESGIICAGLGTDGHGYILEDQSGIYKPTEWAKEAIALHKARRGDRIIAEVNNGGEMVEATLRVVDPNVPYTAIHASRGKAMRAEPVSALYEQGKVHHVGSFGLLEDQMCAFTPDFDRSTAGYSPDRLDALVWALSELMVHDGAPAIPADERDFVCEPIDIPESWPRVYAVDVSVNRVAVLWGAVNKSEDVIYLTAEYVATRADFAVHAAAIRARPKWIPGVVAPRAHGRTIQDGGAIVDRLSALDLDLTSALCDVEATLGQMTQRITTQRLRVFSTLADWLAGYRRYRRDGSGRLPEDDAEMMNATALLCASGVDTAITKPSQKKARSSSGQRSAWGV